MGCSCACQCALRIAQKASSPPMVSHPLIQSFENGNGGISSYDALDYDLKFGQPLQYDPEFITVIPLLNTKLAMDGSALQEDESRLTSLSPDLYSSRISEVDSFLPEIGRGITRERNDRVSLPFFSPQGPQMSPECSNTGFSRQPLLYKPSKPLEIVEHGLKMLGANHKVTDLVLRQHLSFGQDPLDRFLRGSYSTFERLQDSYDNTK